jgi:hypothetical protein
MLGQYFTLQYLPPPLRTQCHLTHTESSRHFGENQLFKSNLTSGSFTIDSSTPNEKKTFTPDLCCLFSFACNVLKICGRLGVATGAYPASLVANAPLPAAIS